MVTLDLASSSVEARPIDLDDVGIDTAAISGDGRSLLTASFHCLSLWDLRVDHSLSNVAHEGMVRSIAISRDGVHVVSCALDSLIVWRINEESRSELGHLSDVCSAGGEAVAAAQHRGRVHGAGHPSAREGSRRAAHRDAVLRSSALVEMQAQ